MKLYVVADVLVFYSEDTRECGEKTSPHMVVDVVICSSGDCEREKKPRHVVRQTRLWSGLVRAVFVRTNRVPQPGGPLPDGWSPRACCKCFWCGYAWCSGTR